MDPLTLSLIGGGGLGLLKGLLIDGPQAAKQNKINAATARYSPWTGMKADTTSQNANVFGDVITGLGLGGMLGQSSLLSGAAPAAAGGLSGPGSAELTTGATALTKTQPAWQTMLQNGFSNPGNYGMRGLSLMGN